MTKFTKCEDTSVGAVNDTADAETDNGERVGKRPSRTTAPSARNVSDPAKEKPQALNEPKRTEDGIAAQNRRFTLDDLDKRLSVKRRTLSSAEKEVLLGQINTLLRESPNSREAAEALLAIRDSATFLLFGGEWADFFQHVLGWPPSEGLRIKKLYEENHWTEVELQQADAKENGTDVNSEAHRALVAPTPTQSGSKPSEAAPQRHANSSRETKGASSRRKAAAGDLPQQKNDAKGSKTAPKKGRADVASVNNPVKAVSEQSLPPDNHGSLASGHIPPVPAAQDGSVTLQADKPASSTSNLSKKEAAVFSECEAVIKENRESFFELGEALRTIRDGKLYRENFATFEEYCRKRWDFTRAWAYAQLKAVNVRDNLCQPMVDIEKLPEPTNERQVRPLAGLEPEQQRAGWKRAVELADGKEITGRLVQKAVREIKPASIPPDKPIDAFDPDETWKGLEKLLLKRLALWPDHRHSDLRARLQGFVAERLPAVAEA